MSDSEIARLERDALTGSADAIRALARIARRAAGEGDDVIRLPLVPIREERGNARVVRNFAVAFTGRNGTRKMLCCPVGADEGFDLDVYMRKDGNVATVANVWGRASTADGKLQLRINGQLALETKR